MSPMRYELGSYIPEDTFFINILKGSDDGV
jgi:hypothetical protein